MKSILAFCAFVCLLTGTTHAVPVIFTWTSETTGAMTPIPGTSTGDLVTVQVLADNGGASTLSQRWDRTHLLSVDLTIGSYAAHYTRFFNTVVPSTGFDTDALGNLTLVTLRGAGGAGDFDSFGTSPLMILQNSAVRASNSTFQSFAHELINVARWQTPLLVVPELTTTIYLLLPAMVTVLKRRR